MEEIEFKKKVLNLLKEDEEFRYAVAGLIGLRTILDELRDLKDRLEAHDRRFEEIMERLSEHDRKFNEIMERLEAHDRRFEEISQKLEAVWARVEVTIGSMGRRWGQDLERTVLLIFKEVLEKEGIKPGEVRKFRFRDVKGEYTGRPGTLIDVDVLIEDSELYILEVKSHAELDHIERLADKVPVVERILNRKASKVYLIAVNMDEEVLDRAKELGIRVIYGNIIPEVRE